MATAPTAATSRTEIVPLLRTEFARNASNDTDTDYLNCYVELIGTESVGDKDFAIVKRPGVDLIEAGGFVNVRGMYFVADFGKLYIQKGADLHITVVATNVTTVIFGFFATNAGEVGFSEYLFDSGIQTLVITDGNQLKMIDAANVVTTSVSPDLPVPHQPYPVFLDGYIFLLKSGTGDLYNSNLNDPLLWTAGDFISCEIQPDQAIRPIKINNYIAVFGTNSIEYFWDAGNTTSSPLQRNDTPVKFNGYLGGFAQWGNQVIFVGNNVEGQPDVFLLEDLKMERIGTATITRRLSQQTALFRDARGSMVTIAGHTFYVLWSDFTTYVYDLTTKLWARWGWQLSNSFNLAFSVNAKRANRFQNYFCLSDDGSIYSFNPNTYIDYNSVFRVWGTTENLLFGGYNQKTMSRVVVQADRVPGAGTMSLGWSDDDYYDYATYVQIDLDQERPSAHRLGRFRRRAFKWIYTQNAPFRIKALEITLTSGTS